MNVLFLDIDGVMNSHQSIRASFRAGGKPKSGREMPFCPIARSNLLEVLARVPGLQIVVSSTWRIGRTLEQLKNDLGALSLGNRIIGMTPESFTLSHRARGHEIQDYLNEGIDKGWDPVTRFVIVDDNSDMAHLMEHLVQTDIRMGLMWDKAMEIMTKFGVDPNEVERGWL